MSDKHDHSHHGHDHGPGGHSHGPEGHNHGPGDHQDHDHDHDHDHGPGGHDHGPGKPAPAIETVMVEDTGSRALAEALKSSFAIVKFIMVAMVIVFIASGVFSVAPQNVAVIFRFGVPKGGDKELLQPGPHWAFPYPIDEVVQIPIGQVQTVTSSVGWYATTEQAELTNTEPGPGDSLNPSTDGYTLTADGNIMHVRAKLRYRISEPIKYAFKFVETTNLVHNALNNAILHASAQYKVDSALRHDRAGFKEKVLQRLQKLIALGDLGVSVDVIEVNAIAPRQVKDAFDAVYGAELDLSKIVNAAQGYTNQILAKAKGEADAIINGGMADRTRLIQSLQSDAQSFSNQLPSYLDNPNLFRERRLTEVMLRITTNGQEKWFLPDRMDGKERELRLLLNPEPKTPKSKDAGAP
jgi:membrane protease subunit HflK